MKIKVDRDKKGRSTKYQKRKERMRQKKEKGDRITLTNSGEKKCKEKIINID